MCFSSPGIGCDYKGDGMQRTRQSKKSVSHGINALATTREVVGLRLDRESEV